MQRRGKPHSAPGFGRRSKRVCCQDCGRVQKLSEVVGGHWHKAKRSNRWWCRGCWARRLAHVAGYVGNRLHKRPPVQLKDGEGVT